MSLYPIRCGSPRNGPTLAAVVRYFARPSVDSVRSFDMARGMGKPLHRASARLRELAEAGLVAVELDVRGVRRWRWVGLASPAEVAERLERRDRIAAAADEVRA